MTSKGVIFLVLLVHRIESATIPPMQSFGQDNKNVFFIYSILVNVPGKHTYI